ncbi:MAG: hypothetical protein IKK92_07950 [Prevotella sp.]|nr:hypothetical protein [Prevotella sp.]
MTTKEVMNLDCRKEENRKIIQKVLRQIKPLSKYSDECDIPIEAIEKAISVMCKKYTMRVNQLTSDVLSNNEYTIWRAWLINDTNLKTIDDVFGVTLYETLAKTAIRLYSEVKKGMKIRK